MLALLILLILFTVIDIAVGVLLLMVSGVAVFGWQNTGVQPEAPLFLLALVLCFALPLAAWLMRRRFGLPIATGIAALPALAALVVLLPSI
jgi:hypothetical protein